MVSGARPGEAGSVSAVGYRADVVERYLDGLSTSMRLTSVYNSEFDGPNGLSLLAAESRVDERFFLQMFAWLSAPRQPAS